MGSAVKRVKEGISRVKEGISEQFFERGLILSSTAGFTNQPAGSSGDWYSGQAWMNGGGTDSELSAVPDHSLGAAAVFVCLVCYCA